MAHPIITLDPQNVKPTPPVPPFYSLGLIRAGCALRRMSHFLYPEGKASALARLEEWSQYPTFLEGQCYVDTNLSTAISTAFFLEVLPPHASCWEGQTYIEVGSYPYLESPRDILKRIFRHDLNQLINPATTCQDTEAASQQTDITGDLIELSILVEVANQLETKEAATLEEQHPLISCEQRFTERELVTLAQALYRVPYSVRRYTKRGDWDKRHWVYYLEPTAPQVGKRFALEAQSFSNPAPWNRPPCTFLTASTSYRFADSVEQRTMTTLWNAAHTPTERLPKLLQRGFVRRAP